MKKNIKKKKVFFVIFEKKTHLILWNFLDMAANISCKNFDSEIIIDHFDWGFGIRSETETFNGNEAPSSERRMLWLNARN